MLVQNDISGLILDLFDMYSTAVVRGLRRDAKVYSEKLRDAYEKAVKDGYDVSLLESCYNSCKAFLYDPEREEKSIEVLVQEYLRSE